MGIIKKNTSPIGKLIELIHESVFLQTVFQGALVIVVIAIVAILIDTKRNELFGKKIITSFRNGITKNNIYKTVGILFLVFLFGTAFYFLFDPENQLHYTMESKSFFIALASLVFASFTYYSIDSVEKKNKMDNNILDAEMYTVAYPRLLEDLNVNDQMKYISKFKEMVETPKIKTCMQFSQWIQEIIDLIVFFVYLNFTTDEEKPYEDRIQAETKKSGIVFVND